MSKIIVADTNWWISLLIKKYQNKFAQIITYPNLNFVSSEDLKKEIIKNLQKERLQKYLDEDLKKQFWLLFNYFVKQTTVSSEVNICRDANDTFY